MEQEQDSHVFRAVHKETGEYYYGSSGRGLEDKGMSYYLGGGLGMRERVDKDTKKDWIKEILAVGTAEETIQQAEALIAEHLGDPLCVNRQVCQSGGRNKLGKPGGNPHAYFNGYDSRFHKGVSGNPETQWKVGVSGSPKTQWKKGMKPWNAGKGLHVVSPDGVKMSVAEAVEQYGISQGSVRKWSLSGKNGWSR